MIKDFILIKQDEKQKSSQTIDREFYIVENLNDSTCLLFVYDHKTHNYKWTTKMHKNMVECEKEYKKILLKKIF